MGCPCEHKAKGDKCKANTPPVLQVESVECPVLFHTVTIPASAGTVETLPPMPGDYRNTRVFYEADSVAYLYDSDGIPQLLAVPGPTAGAGIDITGATISVTSAINGGTTAPTTSTVGTVGALYSYVDSGTGHLAICTDVSGDTYTWTTLI